MPAILLNRISQIRTQSERPFCEAIFARALRIFMAYYADKVNGVSHVFVNVVIHNTQVVTIIRPMGIDPPAGFNVGGVIHVSFVDYRYTPG